MSTNIETRLLPLASFILSRTPMQVERRKERTKEDIAQLADTIKRVGVIHPILVRPVTNQSYEIVAGEGRYLAAKLAGLEEIQATVRVFSDEEAEEVQLIENLQRKDLHELVEALGYEQLQKRGHSADEIALKVGKSKRTIYTRLQLLKLAPAPQEALRRGELSASTALLIARIADPAAQSEACGKITKPSYGEPLSYRQAADLVERDYMLRLADAPFSTKDAQLLPKAGACGACPKRTGNNPDLFGDFKNADVCTDRSCFKLKREAHTAQLLQKAKDHGQRIITGAEAKKAVSYESEHSDHVSLGSGYISLGDKPFEDKKNRSYRQLLGKDVKPIVLKTPKGRVIEVIDKATAAKALKDAGISQRSTSTSPARASGANASAKAQLDQQKKIKERVFRALFDKAPTKIDRKLIEARVNEEIFEGMVDLQELCEALGWLDYDMDKSEKEIAKLPDADLFRLMHVLPHAGDLGGYSTGGELFAAAKKAGVDVDAIRKAVKAEDKAAAAAKKSAKPAAKKKAARKPK